MEIMIKGSEKEIAAFVLDLQKQQNESGHTIVTNISETVDISAISTAAKKNLDQLAKLL